MVKVLIDSNFRDSGTITDYKYIMRHPVKKIRYIRLLQAIFPNSLYMISSSLGTNSFGFTEDPDGTPDAQTITLTTGNYTGTELATELTTQLNATMTGNDYTVTYSSTTNKFTTTKTSGEWTYDSDIAENMRRVLGLDATQVKHTTNWEHTNMMDLSFPRYCLVNVNTDHSSNNEVFTNQPNTYSFLVLLTKDPYEIEKTGSLTDFQQIELNANVDVKHIDVTIRLADGTVPDFNDVDHQLFLEMI